MSVSFDYEKWLLSEKKINIKITFCFFFLDVKNISYTCELCGIKFSIKSTYEEHLKSHNNIEKFTDETSAENSGTDTFEFTKTTEIEPKNEVVAQKSKQKNISEPVNFSCDMCDKSFIFQSLLNHHRTTVHETKRFLCMIDFCDQIFTTAEDLQRHEESVHVSADPNTSTATDSNVKCTYTGCTLLFANNHLLKKHQSIHRLKAYECKGCNKKYYSEGVFKTHVRLCQPTNDDVVLVFDEEIDSGPVLCKMCNQLFENRKVLKFHRKFCADEEAEEADRKRALELRAQLPTSTSTSGDIEEVYVKEEIDDNDEIINNFSA